MRAESVSLNSEVEALLTEAGLPVSDLPANRKLHFLGVREGGRLVGVVGIEVFGPAGLLRSLAVAEAHRECGLGQGLVSDAEALAAGLGVNTLYLLTTTAAAFFARLGYEAVSRSEAPAAIAASAQFAHLCPASSSFMRKVLVANNSPQGRRPRRIAAGVQALDE